MSIDVNSRQALKDKPQRAVGPRKTRRKVDMTEQTQAALVLERFGGYQPMSEMTGFSEQTIRNWVRVGHVPQKHHFDVLVAARRNRIQLLPTDLVAHLITKLLAAAQAGDTTMPGDQPDIAD